MTMRDTNFNVTEGTNVYGSDGDKVGSVVAVGPNYVVVEKGFFFPTDYYIPTSAIANSGDDGVYLNVTKDAALNQGWDTAPPEGGYAETVTTETTYADDAATSVGTERIAAADSTGVIGTDFDAAAGTRIVEDDDTIVVPTMEEELTATKTRREAGEVRIEKDVVSEERVLDVPVTEERVRVERRVVDRPVAAGEGAFEEGVIEVPVMSEEVHLSKSARVSGEVVVDKESVQRTEQVRGTVRREEVRIDDNTVDAGTMTDATIADATDVRTKDTDRQI